MKKLSLETIYTYLNDNGFAFPEIMDELRKEISKGEIAKAKNAEAYEAIHDLIVDNLTDKPCTVAELWAVIEKQVPVNVTKGKVQYALTHLWQDEIVKVDGKPNGYRKA